MGIDKKQCYVDMVYKDLGNLNTRIEFARREGIRVELSLLEVTTFGQMCPVNIIQIVCLSEQVIFPSWRMSKCQKY